MAQEETRYTEEPTLKDIQIDYLTQRVLALEKQRDTLQGLLQDGINLLKEANKLIATKITQEDER